MKFSVNMPPNNGLKSLQNPSEVINDANMIISGFFVSMDNKMKT